MGRRMGRGWKVWVVEQKNVVFLVEITVFIIVNTCCSRSETAL